ncbi:phage tail protein [Hymenobacter convexus]|uniref:phage tail protein n=1 Tax=Hymenobacter sp. CA1UV-4 TaxID=3063782 RepID=UPI00271372AE|nr:tail fiber protein [Hymenobacter sp. CA1UV-4]MDO7851419.1 tail fiber protein [Hymenobacter sp. CA1UV-4]
MDEPYLGEIHLIASNYAPSGYAFCNGQLLSIAQNSALFSLLGTQFGGDGQTTFALPDLRGRIPVGPGASPGGSFYTTGQQGGSEGVVLSLQQMPAHTHPVSGTLQTSNTPEADDPANNLPADGGRAQYSSGAADAPMTGISGNTGVAGGAAAHENRQPYVALNYVIALTGYYPTRQ